MDPSPLSPRHPSAEREPTAAAAAEAAADGSVADATPPSAARSRPSGASAGARRPGAADGDDAGDLLASVLAAIRRHRLLTPGHRVLVAVSGGRDSMVLLDCLWRLRERLALGALGVAHVDHGLRPESEADARWVAEQAAIRGLPFLLRRVRIERGRRSLEEAARAARYRALVDMAAEFGAQRVALAHHAGDQAETVLLRLLAGAGLRGLAGMRPRRGRFVRPLLGVTPDRLAAYAAARGLSWRDDPTNRDLAIRRNRIRHRLLPLLEAEFNPRVIPTLARVAAALAAEADLLTRRTRHLEARLAVGTGRAWACRVADLERLPPADQRRLLQAAYHRRTGRPLPWTHGEAVRELVERAAAGRGGTVIHLPGGWQARCDGTWLWLEPVPSPASGGGDGPGPAAVPAGHEGASRRPARRAPAAEGAPEPSDGGDGTGPQAADRRPPGREAGVRVPRPGGAWASGDPEPTTPAGGETMRLPVPGAVPLGCGLWLRARWLEGEAARQAEAAVLGGAKGTDARSRRGREGARFAFRALIEPPVVEAPDGGPRAATGAAGEAPAVQDGGARSVTAAVRPVLLVRRPRPGETLQPLGARGRRPVERLYRAAVRRGDLYLIDPERGTGAILPPWVVVVGEEGAAGPGDGRGGEPEPGWSGGAGAGDGTREGTVLWLVGVRVAEAGRVRRGAGRLLCLEVTARPPLEAGPPHRPDPIRPAGDRRASAPDGAGRGLARNGGAKPTVL
ncbi:MAG TPA: tRNA lysidine(34) synthetase TilS [Thermaerobacter sp.]